MNEIAAWASAIGLLGTAVALWLNWIEVRQTQQIAQSEFEDDYSREYRELAQGIPIEALLGENIPDEEYRKAFDKLFRYIDLCNEQVFLHSKGRIGNATWINWRSGIKSNLELPAFKKAWEEIKKRCESFQELRDLEQSGYQ